MKIYDIILIGSGPSAVASLLSFDKDISSAVITGYTHNQSRDINCHAKFRFLSKKLNKPLNLTDSLHFKKSKVGSISNCSIVGGMTNYWGQQFDNYLKEDPWSREIFKNYNHYINISKLIKSNLPIYYKSQTEKKNNIEIDNPKILTAQKNHNFDKYNEIAGLFNNLIKKNKVSVIDSKVVSIIKRDGNFELYTSKYEKIISKKIILAAGCYGSSLIAMNSFEKIKRIKFKDHAPELIYYIRKKNWPNFKNTNSIKNMNSKSYRVINKNKTELFASFYQMSNMPIGLILSNFNLPIINLNISLPEFLDIFCPIQVWSKNTFQEYEIDRNSKFANFYHHDQFKDNQLDTFKSTLKDYGSIVSIRKTPPGFGFHYHRGQVTLDNNNYVSLNKFLKEEYGENLLLSDSSALQNIGVVPPTLTYMATSYQLSKEFLK